MNKSSKILTIIGMIILFLVIFFAHAAMEESSGHKNNGAMLDVILFFGLIAGIRVVWKYKPEPKSSEINDDDKHKLDKKL